MPIRKVRFHLGLGSGSDLKFFASPFCSSPLLFCLASFPSHFPLVQMGDLESAANAKNCNSLNSTPWSVALRLFAVMSLFGCISSCMGGLLPAVFNHALQKYQKFGVSRKRTPKCGTLTWNVGSVLGICATVGSPHLLSDTTCVTGSVVYRLVCLTCSVLCICPMFSQCYSVVIYTVSSGSPNVITCVVVGCGADDMPPSSWNW